MESQVVSVAAQALRAFFRYAETRGWCATGFAKGIQGPRIYKYEGVPEGPSWEQVRRLTRGLIGDAEFAVMKKNAVVINVGRGPTIDALDVFDQEPLPQGHPFYSLENVLLSPHCADHTPDWLDNAMRFFLEQLERFRRGERLFNVVDKALGY
jgi:phosphoglycerate dehydrogenase-like enzyme